MPLHAPLAAAKGLAPYAAGPTHLLLCLRQLPLHQHAGLHLAQLLGGSTHSQLVVHKRVAAVGVCGGRGDSHAVKRSALHQLRMCSSKAPAG